METTKPHDPSLSVIITAHDRRQFVRGAVESVVNQTINPDRVEIIVVKNYVDEDLERFLEQSKIHHLLEPDSSLGKKVETGLVGAAGEVICLLEDDDLFEPNKLEVISNLFGNRPELGYYHNGYTTIDSEGRPIALGRAWQKRHARGTRDEVEVCGPLQDARQSLRFLGYAPNYNDSSISFRRTLIRGFSSELRRAGIVVDNFLFLCSLMSPVVVRADHQPLTRIRIHGSNVSPQSAAREKLNFVRLQDYSIATRGAQASVEAADAIHGNSATHRLVQASMERDLAVEALRFPNLSRLVCHRQFRRLIGLRDTYYAREHSPLLPTLALGIVSPRTAQLVYAVGKRLGY